MRPDLLGSIEFGQTHNHGLFSAVDHGSHHLAIINLPCFEISSIAPIIGENWCIISQMEE